MGYRKSSEGKAKSCKYNLPRVTDKPEYGSHLIEQLSADLSEKFWEGFSRRNVFNFRRFYLTHKKVQPAAQLDWSQYVELLPVKDDTVRAELEREVHNKNLSKREVKTLVKDRLDEIKAKAVESRVVEVETEFVTQFAKDNDSGW